MSGIVNECNAHYSVAAAGPPVHTQRATEVSQTSEIKTRKPLTIRTAHTLHFISPHKWMEWMEWTATTYSHIHIHIHTHTPDRMARLVAGGGTKRNEYYQNSFFPFDVSGVDSPGSFVIILFLYVILILIINTGGGVGGEGCFLSILPRFFQIGVRQTPGKHIYI